MTTTDSAQPSAPVETGQEPTAPVASDAATSDQPVEQTDSSATVDAEADVSTTSVDDTPVDDSTNDPATTTDVSTTTDTPQEQAPSTSGSDESLIDVDVDPCINVGIGCTDQSNAETGDEADESEDGGDSAADEPSSTLSPLVLRRHASHDRRDDRADDGKGNKQPVQGTEKWRQSRQHPEQSKNSPNETQNLHGINVSKFTKDNAILQPCFKVHVHSYHCPRSF